MSTSIPVGARAQVSLSVDGSVAAPEREAGALSLLALTRAMEDACRKATDDNLADGELSIGVSLSVSRLAPTPADWQISVTAEVTSVNQNRIRCKVIAADRSGTIAIGEQIRTIVNRGQFLEQVAAKASMPL